LAPDAPAGLKGKVSRDSTDGGWLRISHPYRPKVVTNHPSESVRVCCV
jgi:hypothetical protein